GEYNVSATFNVTDLSPFLAGDEDLRANPSQEEGNDEDIRAVKTRGPVQVPVGPMTRARAKRFKEELNNLVRRVLQQEESVFTTESEQRLVLLIQADPVENQSAKHVL
ncbi:hypothetical protein PanWU01x14_013720, partial [Parasponia andersonii]